MKILSLIVIFLNVVIYAVAGMAIENEGKKKESTILYLLALFQIVPIIYLIN